jgi:hypothetical protein
MPSDDEDEEELFAVGEYTGEDGLFEGERDLDLGGGLYRGGGDRE